MKVAKALAIRELGTASGLERDKDDPPEAYTYQMKLGKLRIIIDNDYCGESGLIRLKIDTGCSGRIERLFSPETFEEDFSAEDKNRQETRNEELINRIHAIGLIGCKKILEGNYDLCG